MSLGWKIIFGFAWAFGLSAVFIGICAVVNDLSPLWR